MSVSLSVAKPADQPDSLFRPVDVPLYPASGAPTGMNWAVLRIALHEQASGRPLDELLAAP